MNGDQIWANALATKDGMSLPEIWQQLHSNAREWRDVPRNSKFYELREMIDESDRKAMRQLSDVPFERWQHVCHGAGWTPLGAVAMSWCRDIPDVRMIAEAWHYSGISVTSDELVLRAIRLSNPGFLPRYSALSDIIDFAKGDGITCALLMAVAPGGLKIDVDSNTIAHAPSDVRPMLDYFLGNDDF